MTNEIYSLEEQRSLAFYQGNTEIQKEIKEDLVKFYSTPKSFLILNSLMYDGIENEQIRIENEKKYLDEKLLYFIEEIVNVYINIFRLMKRQYELTNRKEMLNTYRLDREYSLECLKKGSLVSLTSTSKNLEFDEKYFREKDGLVILNFKIPVDIPCIDVNDVLGTNSKFSKQREVLLPPFFTIDIKEVSLSEKEKTYQDINHEPPIGKFEILIADKVKEDTIDDDREQLEEYLFNKENIYNAVDVIHKMNLHSTPQIECVERYIKWKKAFRKLIRIHFNEIFAFIKRRGENE